MLPQIATSLSGFMSRMNPISNSAICFTGSQARADFNIEIGNGGIKIGVDGNKQRPPQKKYTVRLYRPRELGGGGGGVVYTRSGLTYQQAMNYSSSFEQIDAQVFRTLAADIFPLLVREQSTQIANKLRALRHLVERRDNRGDMREATES